MYEYKLNLKDCPLKIPIILDKNQIKLKLNKKTLEKILKWSWNIIFLYVLAAMIIIIADLNINSEIYYESDCKPLINLMDKFNKYVNPAWPAFIILVVASYLLNGWSYINKNKTHGRIWKALQFIRSSLWNLFFVYIAVISFLIIYDSNKNPELYAAAEFNDIFAVQPQDYLLKNILPEIEITLQEDTEQNKFINPGWFSKASSIDDCKPLINLLDKFNTYAAPVWPVFIILIVLTFIIVFWDQIKKGIKDKEE